MKRLLHLLLFLGIILIPASAASAQTYAFSLDREVVHLYWESDGTLDIEYEMVFSNAAFADPLDVVDLGLPNDTYSMAGITATINGRPVDYMDRNSPYLDIGPAIYFGSHAIRPGDTGTVHVFVEGIQNVLYTDNQDEAYASAVFSPTYFDSEFVSGRTDLTVAYHLPPGVDPSEPRWHPAPNGFPDQPTTGFDDDGRITYTWRNARANGHSFYLFGASFPRTYVPAGAISEPTFAQRTGISQDTLIGFVVFFCFCSFIIFIIVISVVSERRRKLRYLPPKVSIAGHGIKRGLTAPEAGILLEQPMDKILTMILFSVVKKGAATVTRRDPLELEVADKLPDDLREYEVMFVEAFREGGRAARRKGLQKMMVALVNSVARKLKGFSKRETVDYYRSIMEQAWKQVQDADTPEVKSKLYTENLEWTMLDRNFDRRTREVFTGPVFVPHWWGGYDPGYGRTAGRTAGIPSGGGKSSGAPSVPTGGGKVSLPTLPGGDFAASVVGGVQNMAGGLIGSLSDFTGGVTRVTNPPPPPSRSSSGGGGWSGGGSSCACACAGCACACAGGGR